MSMTLLELVQAVTSELATVAVPAAVASSPDLQQRQFMALANNLGRMLASDYEWQELEKEYTFPTVASTITCSVTDGSAVVTMSSTSGLSTDYGVTGTGMPNWAQVESVDSATQVTLNQESTYTGSVDLLFSQNIYDLPSGFKSIINDTEWDRTNRWPLLGPKSPQEWQFIKGGVVSNGPRLRFRIMDNRLLINPNPSDGHIIAFEYISNAWASSSTGTDKTAFSADSDTCVFDDQLMINGIKLLWLQAKGLEWAPVERQFLSRLEVMQARTQGAKKLSLSRDLPSIYIGPWSIPDGNWGNN